MVQVGILGKLEFRELDHGWAIDLGSQLSRYMFLLSTSIVGEEHRGTDVYKAFHNGVDFLNRLLRQRGLQTRVPEEVESHGEIVDTALGNLLNEMDSKCTISQVAFFLISMINTDLILTRAAGLEEKAPGVVANRVSLLYYKCGELNIDTEALFSCISNNNGTLALRQLLRELLEPMTILMVSAEPHNGARLRLSEEHRVLNEALRSSELRQAFRLHYIASCRPQDLLQGIQLHRPKILHFSGHGVAKGLCFEDEQGLEKVIDATSLARLLKLAARDIGLKGIVMNACYTEQQAKIIADSIGNVVAMGGALDDSAAIAFSRAFYTTLGNGMSFGNAFEWAEAQAGLTFDTSQLKPHLVTGGDGVRVGREVPMENILRVWRNVLDLNCRY